MNRSYTVEPNGALLLEPKLREFGVPFSLTVTGNIREIAFAGKTIFQVPVNVQVETVTLRIDPVRRAVVGMSWNEQPESVSTGYSADEQGQAKPYIPDYNADQ